MLVVLPFILHPCLLNSSCQLEASTRKDFSTIKSWFVFNFFFLINVDISSSLFTDKPLLVLLYFQIIDKNLFMLDWCFRTLPSWLFCSGFTTCPPRIIPPFPLFYQWSNGSKCQVSYIIVGFKAYSSLQKIYELMISS